MTFKVVLIRHAIVNINPKIGSTSAISLMGRAIQKQMDEYLKEIGVIPTEVWHSPVQRAKETAAQIASDFNVPLMAENSLGEMLDEIELTEKLALVDPSSCIFCVSHGPQIMRLCTFYVGRSLFKTQITNSSAVVLEFQKEVSEGNGVFVKSVAPELVMRVKGKPRLT